jgi:hypothetical protein
MLAISRLLMIAAVLTGVCALIARFMQPALFLMILPATWLEVTGTLLLFCIGAALLGIADQMAKKTL